jgi:hypothetical protein
MKLPLNVFLSALIFSTLPSTLANSEEPSAQLSVELNWENFAKEHHLMDVFSKELRFPKMLVYRNQELIGLFPSAFPVNLDKEKISIDIGFPQIVERPLYQIQIAKLSSGKYVGEISVSQFEIYSDYKAPNDKIGALLYKGYTKEKLEIGQLEKKTVSISAQPYAAVGILASKWKIDITNHVLPVIEYEKGKRLTPVGEVMAQQGQVFASDPKTLAAAVSIRRSVIYSWFRNAANFFRSIVAPPPVEKVKIASNPKGATVTILGGEEREKTNNTFPAARAIWDSIVLSKKEYKNCPYRIKLLDDKQEPPVFHCNLVKK